MEHKNTNIADLDASEVVAQETKITSVSPGSTPADQRPAATGTFQGWKPPAHEQQSSGDKASPLMSSALFSFASSSAPDQFQFPPQASAPPASAGSNPSSVNFPSFGGSAPALGRSSGGATAAASLPTFGCTSSSATGGSAAASAQAFGSSSAAAAAGSPAFGCSQQSLFATPAAATATRTACPFSFTINGTPGVPAGFFHGFNQQVQWTMPGFRHPWPNSGLPLNAKRCYCGKVAGVRFSNTTDGTLGLFYCCPDYNEEAIRSGTQDRNYCTYTEWSNGGFSVVRKCYCGKVAVLQKSEKFGTWGKLFYSCPEYREKETVLLFGNRGQYCSYIEWSSSSPAPAPASAPAPQAPAVQFFG